MNNWNKLLYKLTGRALLDPQTMQDLYDKVSRLTHERDEARNSCRELFKDHQEYLKVLAAAAGAMDEKEWPRDLTPQLVKQFAQAWATSKALPRYQYPLTTVGGTPTYIHPLMLYPAEARLELSRFGLI